MKSCQILFMALLFSSNIPLQIQSAQLHYQCKYPSYALDNIGYRRVCDDAYLKKIQSIENRSHGSIIQISKRYQIIDDIGRFEKTQMRLIKKSKNNSIYLVNGRPWDIEKCLQRLKTNVNDGDARLIIGRNFLREGEYVKAAEVLEAPKTSIFTFFTISALHEWHGYAYYELGRKEKIKDNTGEFYRYLMKEQKVYISAFKGNKKLTQASRFRHLYALTFVDLGLFLEELEKHGPVYELLLPESIIINTSGESYTKASEILSKLNKITNEVQKNRAFVFSKLGNSNQAKLELIKLGNDRKMSIFKIARDPIRREILNGLNNKNLMTEDFKKEYEKVLSIKYGSQGNNSQHIIDSLISDFLTSTAINSIKVFPKAQVLPIENKNMLLAEIQSAVKRQINDSLMVVEVNYLWHSIKRLASKKHYKIANQKILRYEDILRESHIANELKTMEKLLTVKIAEIKKKEEERQKKLRKKELAKAKKMQEERDKQEEEARLEEEKKEKQKAKKIDKKDSSIKKVKKEPATKTHKNKDGTVAKHKRIGMLIDNLIAKKDYIGAYRGIKAYESMLKAHFSKAEIDKTINNLEMLVERDYGEKYLKKLRKEVRKK